MNTLTKEQQSLVVAVLCQNLIKAYRLLSNPEGASGNRLTPTGRNDLNRFASELYHVLLALEMPGEDLEQIAARYGVVELSENQTSPSGQ
jgi:hypothetical protein